MRKKKRYEPQLRQEIRIIIRAYKSKGCSICGYNKCLDALDFHHSIPKRNGKLDIAGMVSRVNSRAALKRIVKELSGCIVVCANCHREIHFAIGDTRISGVEAWVDKKAENQISLPFVEFKATA